MTRPHVLLCRLDNAGDVLLAGPAVRAVAAGARRVTFVAGPNGAAAARLLPGVDDVLVHRAPWIDPSPEPVTRERELAFVDDLAAREVDEAILFTSFHQSALPLALLLRFAGVRRIAAVSEDYPGALLDVRHRPAEMHEVERNLSLVATLGYRLPAEDTGRLAVRAPLADVGAVAGAPGYVVVHPGASVPARAFAPERCRVVVDELLTAGFRVVVTGAPNEQELTALVTGRPRVGVKDLGGATDLAGLASVLSSASAVVTGNTGPAHLAAAVGTPVVELYAPTVPALRWRPWGVRHVLLGDQDIACGGCRARRCPQPTHACLDGVRPADVVNAVRRVLADPDVTVTAGVRGIA